MKINKYILLFFVFFNIHAYCEKVMINFIDLPISSFVQMYARITNTNILFPPYQIKNITNYTDTSYGIDKNELHGMTSALLEQNNMMFIPTPYGYKIIYHNYEFINNRYQKIYNHKNQQEVYIDFRNKKIHDILKISQKILGISILEYETIRNNSINFILGSSYNKITRNELFSLLEDMLEYEGKMLVKLDNNIYKIIKIKNFITKEIKNPIKTILFQIKNGKEKKLEELLNKAQNIVFLEENNITIVTATENILQEIENFINKK